MKHRIPEAVLPSHGAGVGPFAPRGAPKTPAPAVVYLACFGCAVFLVLCVVSEHHVARETELDVRGDGGGRRLTQWLAPVWYSLPTLFDSLYNLVRPRAPSSPPSRPRALTVRPPSRLVSNRLLLLRVKTKTRQGEAWTNFQLLPEEYRLAAEANARAAMLRATEGIGADAFAPEPAPENAAVADAAAERYRAAFDAPAGYEPFPEYPDAARMMRR